MSPPRWHRLLPFLAWPRPHLDLLRGEALAGLTVGLMVIPQGVAYAALAGMPLVTGIYASLLPALVAVLFVLANTVVDMLYTVVDPRVRAEVTS